MTSLFPSIRFGGDYNPDQWPLDVQIDDVRLMQGAGVTTATVAVFAWAKLEPRPGEYDFAWLDEVLDRLHAGGIRVFLATATASPPAWLARLHPESLPVTEDGVRFGFGSRQQYSPSSPVYREHAMKLVRAMAERYGSHPALEAWHTNNEYGCHIARSYDDASVEAFRVWLEARYGTIEELNRVWGTAFWSQAYGSFDEIDAPRTAPSFRNPTQLLDFDRFSSNALLSLHRAEVEILREITPNVPITTNFMGFFRDVDYWAWAEHVDFVTDDAYPDPADPKAYIRLGASRDLMRSLGGGQPWLLMEQSTSAVNWRERNAPKPAGMNRLHSLQAVGRGSDGVLYFQWRQSKAGAEKFHAALVPHAGEHSRVHREVQALGAELAGLGDVLGTGVDARVGIVFDWASWWAVEQPATPGRIDYVETVLSWYAAFQRRGVTIDFVREGADLSAYSVVVAPVFHAASAAAADELARFADAGGHLVIGHQSIVLDENLHVHLGGYLGGEGSALQATLGARVEEFAPGQEGSTFALAGELAGRALDWQEFVVVDDAEVLARFDDGITVGEAAITRRATTGGGAAWYVATQPDDALADAIIARVLAESGTDADFDEPRFGLETVVRGGRRFVFNHTPETVTVTVGGRDVTLGAYGAESWRD
ncbi:beta-galactosidase [Agromyces atrinae]|uniref:beta-galactosidase n=1 Tax=Agromyces atrinae TaxID=592376 RepID=UPI001F5931E1|nr:beta-galactosidase [Agromyces atrinae]MCI2957587.1 beta-galactosidase [Agromyces atrinae]